MTWQNSQSLLIERYRRARKDASATGDAQHRGHAHTHTRRSHSWHLFSLSPRNEQHSVRPAGSFRPPHEHGARYRPSSELIRRESQFFQIRACHRHPTSCACAILEIKRVRERERGLSPLFGLRRASLRTRRRERERESRDESESARSSFS